ncbi:MAG: competence type IV pilus minor pilin ComGD [Bacilli bacterium]
MVNRLQLLKEKLKRQPHQHNNKSSGFTLVEVTIVLFIASILITLGLHTTKRMMQTYNMHLALATFIDTVQRAQMLSISEGVPYSITFDGLSNTTYVCYRANRPNVIVSVELPEGVKIERGSKQLPLTFNTRGNINGGGGVRFVSEDDVYAVVFLIGRGRYYVTRGA